MVCGVALCCDKRLTFVNVATVRFTRGMAIIVKMACGEKRRQRVAKMTQKRSSAMQKRSEGNAKAK